MENDTRKSVMMKCIGCDKPMQVRVGQPSEPECKPCRRIRFGEKPELRDCSGGCGSAIWTKSESPMCQPCRRGSLKHGTSYAYGPRGCRCDECVTAARASARISARRRRILKVKTCVVCAESFNPRGQQITCSPQCRRKYQGSTGTHKSRAMFYGARYEKVDRIEVFERDRWMCGICGAAVDSSLSYPHPMSASLDHIVPLSCGGDHLNANAQCAHLTCNRYKSNKAAAA